MPDLTFHTSTVRPATRIVARLAYVVEIRTGDEVTYTSHPVSTETQARELFERVVIDHENGDSK